MLYGCRSFLAIDVLFGPWELQVVILLTIGAATLAAAKARMRTVRSCGTCRGYGIQRCRLCSGKGAIEWEGKMAHREPCPMCLGRRFNRCECCGGVPAVLGAGRLFSHARRSTEAALAQQLGSLSAAAVMGSGSESEDDDEQGSAGLLGRLRRRRTSKAALETIDQSEAFAEQIMMD
jgi:hypothetical protein